MDHVEFREVVMAAARVPGFALGHHWIGRRARPCIRARVDFPISDFWASQPFPSSSVFFGGGKGAAGFRLLGFGFEDNAKGARQLKRSNYVVYLLFHAFARLRFHEGRCQMYIFALG